MSITFIQAFFIMVTYAPSISITLAGMCPLIIQIGHIQALITSTSPQPLNINNLHIIP